jgi:uncharacterized phage-associated protein
MNIIDLSKYIVNQFSDQSPAGITPMKLQKLLYYVKAWTLVAGKQLLQEDFRHWNYGPVNRDVYEYYKQYRGNVISPSERDELNISESEKELVDFIVENYIQFDAFTLSAMTHTEEPWKITKKDDVISNNLIISYYSRQQFAQNFKPFDLSNNSFYPLESYSFVADMTTKDAREIAKYSSYSIYRKALDTAEKEFEQQWSNLILI